jgi:hypothetical protein
MKKSVILMIALMVINVGFLSGCNEQQSETIDKQESIMPDKNNEFDEPLGKDTDNDGLNDTLEIEIGTDPDNPNSDGDRYTDGEEYNDTIPSYVEEESRSPLFPAYPDIEVELGETFHIWLKQDITVSTGTIESKDYEYNIECTTSSTTDWSNVLTIAAGFGITGPSVYAKDTFSYHSSKTHTMKTSQNYRMATGQTWSKAVATDLGDSYLYITLRITNAGTDILESEIRDIWLSLYIGEDEDPIKTWSFGNSYIGGSICPLLPGDVRTVNAEFDKCLSVETLKRIDSGEPVRIEVQSYNIGNDNRYLQNVKDTLVQLDIDTGTDIETNYIQEDSISLVDFLKKYADAVITSGNSFQSIDGLSIDDNNWWNIILPKKTDLPEDITLAEIESGDHVVLIYEQDTDNDRITNRLEIMAGTNPNLVDSDGDGLNDYDELYEIYGETNPLLSDTDFDGLSDYEEVFNGNDGYVTDPQESDSDNDDLSDYNEYLNNTNPTNSDTDGDGLKDGEECKQYGTNPIVADTDNDGLEDGDEIERGTDPLDEDSDGDGLNDGDEIAASCDPLDKDSDDDGYEDGSDNIPTKNASIKVTIIRFKVKDEVDWFSDSAQVYRKIKTEDETEVRWPADGNEWNVKLDEMKVVNWDYVYDVPDDQLTHTIVISLLDADWPDSDDYLDIDGIHTGSNTNSLTIYYNIESGEWTGDDNDGISDGSYDGVSGDDDDAYLEYNITTI